jgi:hypothetical protein
MTKGEELRDPRVKVWPVSRIVVVSLIYIALATGAAMVSMEVAMDRVQDMGHYQVEKTREFLGRERAKELDEFMHGGANAEEADADAEAEANADADAEALTTPPETEE